MHRPWAQTLAASRQDRQQITLAQREAAEAGNRRLLEQQLADLCGVFIHASLPHGEIAAGLST